MYWLRRPPYLRWMVAGLVLLGGLYLDLRPDAGGEPYPFAARLIAAGEPVSTSIIWRDVPRGLLPQWDAAPTGTAGRTIPEGHPLLPGTTTNNGIPTDWWAVPIPLPVAAPPGTAVRVMLDGNGAMIDGIVTATGLDDGYLGSSFETVAMVAFPPADAERVAKAAVDDALIVMVGVESIAPATSG